MRQRLSSRSAIALALLGTCFFAAAGAAPTGNTVATGRLKNEVIASITTEAKRQAQCADLQSIRIASQHIEPSAQFGSDGSLLIGSATERWEATLCGKLVGFTVTFTGNGMLGPRFRLQKE
jgi:hypothetical protein